MESPEKPDLVANGYKLVSSDSEEARTYYHYASDELGSITHIVKAAVYKKLEEDRQIRLPNPAKSGKMKVVKDIHIYLGD